MSDPHKWHRYRWLNYDICVYCGLIALRNEITTWCIRNGCDYRDHPQYTAILKRLTTHEAS